MTRRKDDKKSEYKDVGSWEVIWTGKRSGLIIKTVSYTRNSAITKFDNNLIEFNYETERKADRIKSVRLYCKDAR